MSAAILILCAAQKRTAAGNSRFLFHPPKRYYKENELVEEELSWHIKDHRNVISSYNEIVGKTTKKPAKKISDLCKRQTILSAQEAFELGLLTERPA